MVRVRIAPSPTGEPHVGNVRTFLYNWLFARQKGGKFVVRIEDTDQKRYQEGSQSAILEGLRWLGLDWDEGPGIGGEYGPYIQSERTDLYQKYARQLVESGAAYYCFCTPNQLEEMRHRQTASNQAPRYDGTCRQLSTQEAQHRVDQGESHVIRLKVPATGTVSWEDLIHGRISFDYESVDDQVLLKSDGFPTYHLAVVIDDHLMEISHILRADEWVSSTPKQILLYQALGWEIPAFGHLPMVMGPDKSKLSKRHGATSVLSYRAQGYLPETMINFLALLGWSYDDKEEIFSREDLIAKFDLTKVNPTNPVFDFQKLEWLNGVYIRALSPLELATRLLDFDNQWQQVDRGYFEQVVAICQERLKTLAEFTDLSSYFFTDTVSLDRERISQIGLRDLENAEILSSVQSLLDTCAWEAEELENCLRQYVSRSGHSPKEVFSLLREILTGQKSTPPLFSVMTILGKDKVVSRLALGLKALGSY